LIFAIFIKDLSRELYASPAPLISPLQPAANHSDPKDPVRIRVDPTCHYLLAAAGGR
jgi:hypothetical protein